MHCHRVIEHQCDAAGRQAGSCNMTIDLAALVFVRLVEHKGLI